MMSHLAFVALAYGVTALTVAAMVLAIVLDGRARRRELADLEARGIRRRAAGADGIVS
ncbi:heme exporter protein D [Hoeflea marina]|uniref:Heme exporter protein D n=1 Tax=Hoeflea marina TaxID=274592 RepID=A0A317PJ92_9HYPH|nr:heme exporter protein CcmD [Hoeflea marina]PWV98293.1 heme exporter protein D [Hoeflea marina]